MKQKIVATLVFLLAVNFSFAQKPYFTRGGDFIFSYGLVTDDAGQDVTSSLRFSCWYHFSETMNIDFGKGAGMITGVGMENVGIITKPKDDYTVKQRAYALGVPLGLRFGDLENSNFIALGAEGELMLDYKEKVFNGNDKVRKHHEWLSNNTNLLNPSVFLKYQKKSLVITAKYYLFDFLIPSNILTEEGSAPIPASAISTSKMFYISIGYSNKGKSKGKKISEPKKVNLT